MTDNDALVREQIADIIDERVSSPAFYGDQNMEAAHRRDQLCAADEVLAALRSTPQAKSLDLPAQDEVEVVARAIASAHGDCFDSAFNNKREWVANRGEKGGRFRDINEPMQSDYLDMATAAIATLDRHRAGDDALREENARLRAVVDALAVLMPIQVHDGRDYAEVFFADGATHSTQAMTMNPQHWRDLTDAYDRAALTGGQG